MYCQIKSKYSRQKHIVPAFYRIPHQEHNKKEVAHHTSDSFHLFFLFFITAVRS